MTSKILVAVLLSLTVASQIHAAAGDTSPTSTKVAQASPYKSTEALKRHTPPTLRSAAAGKSGGAPARESRTQDSSEQSTRMSCCP